MTPPGGGHGPPPSDRPRETIQAKIQRHRKSRMDARTRERLRLLVLVRSAARQHADARYGLELVRHTRSATPSPPPGEPRPARPPPAPR